jgi:hypothetical protein
MGIIIYNSSKLLECSCLYNIYLNNNRDKMYHLLDICK